MRNGRFSFVPGARLGLVAAAVGLSLIVAACGSSSGGDKSPTTSGGNGGGKVINVSFGVSSPTMSNAVLYVAMDHNFLEKAGINLQTVQLGNGGSAKQALQSGESDFTITSAASAIQANAQGLGFYDVMNITSSVFELCVSKQFASKSGLKYGDSPDTIVKALQNSTFGVSALGDGPDIERKILFRSYLGSSGQSARVVALGSLPAEEAAMKQGRVDAIMGGAPFCENIEQQGAGVKVLTDLTVPSIKPLPGANLLTTKKFADANPEAVQRIVNAFKAAGAFIRSNPTAAATTLKKFFTTLPDAIIADSVNQVVIPAMVPSGRASVDVWTQLATDMKEAHAVTGTVPSTNEDVMWTNKFVGE